MRFAGSSSWSLRESQDQEPNRLLHLRQVLVGQRVVLDPPALRHRPPAVDVPPDRVPAALVAWQQRWLDALALVVLKEGDDLADGDLDTVRRGSVPYPVVREVAEDLAFDRGVDPGRVRATVVLLDAEDDAGAWWREVAPGVALCSFDAALHPVTARVVLRRAFAARL